jgi:hypothetical protein
MSAAAARASLRTFSVHWREAAAGRAIVGRPRQPVAVQAPDTPSPLPPHLLSDSRWMREGKEGSARQWTLQIAKILAESG